MNCKHCGYPVNRGQKLCPSCGAPVRRGHKGLWVLLAIVLILVIAAVGFLHRRDIGNFFVTRGMSSEEYYRHTELQNYDDISGLLVKLAGKGPAVSAAAPGHDRFGLTFRLGDTARQFLANVNTSGISLDWIEALGLQAETNAQDGRYALRLALQLNDVALVNLDGAFDPDEGAIALRVPELSETAILTTMEELGFTGEGPGAAEIMEALGRLPSAEKQREIFGRYLALALEQVTNVEKGSGTLKAETLSRDCTLLTVRLTDSELAAIARSLCLALHDDEETLTLAAGVLQPLSPEPDAVRGSLLQKLEELAARLESFESRGESCVMKVYVDAAGRIAGRERTIERAKGELVLSRAVILKGGRFALERRSQQGGENAALVGGGKLQGLGLTGQIKALYKGTEMLTLNMDGALKGLIKGACTLTLRPERALLRALELDETVESLAKDLLLRLAFSNTESPAQLTLALLHDEDDFITTDLEHTELPAEVIDFPTEGQSPAEWVKGIKLPGLFGNGSFGVIFDNLTQAGLPGELLMGAKLLLPQLLK